MRGVHKLVLATLLILSTVSTVSASPAELTIFPKEATAPVDSYASYEVEVENTGPVKDHYSILTETSEVTAQPNSFYLDSGQTKTVYVWYDPEVSKDAGRYSFPVTAESRATGERYSVTGIANVVTEHSVDLAIEGPESVCRGDTAEYNVEVTNTGIQPEEFEITTGYGELSQNKVNLQEEETKTVTITASSEEEVTENFNVRASSTTSYAKETQNVQFNAEPCYESGVSVTPESAETAAFTEQEFEVTVNNVGTKTDSFAVSSSHGTLSDSTVELEPSASETLNLSVTPEELGTETITITSEGRSVSDAAANLEVYNGNDVDVQFQNAERQVCEDESFTYTAEVENTGEASESYNLSTTDGELSDESVNLQPGDSEEVDVSFNSSNYDEDSEQNFELTASSNTFDQPVKTAEGSFNVQNCWDLEMNVVPNVKSAGENTSTVYEVRLNNTGTQTNEYILDYEGPEWVEIRPESVEVEAGETGIAYIYAGIPYEKQGEVEITAIGTGQSVQKSETVRLVIGEEIEDAIESDEGGDGITGRFTQSASSIFNSIQQSNTLVQIALSVLVAVVLTAFILYRD